MIINSTTAKAFLVLNTLIVFFYFSVGFPQNILFLITNFLILQLSSAGLLYKPKQYYSLSKFFYMYSFFFFGIVPYLDMVNEVYYWGGSKLDIHYFITANIIIIMCLIVYYYGYTLSKHSINIESIVKKEQARFFYIQRHIKKIIIFLLIISLIASYLIFAKNNFDFLTMLVRGLIEDGMIVSKSSMSQIELLFYSNVVIPLPVLALLLFGYISFGRRQLYIKSFLIIFLLIVFVFVAPTSIARFLAIVLYLSILLKFTKLLERKYIFQIGSIFGLLVILPFLDKFRRFSDEGFTFTINFNFLSAGHFDGYQNFVRIISMDYLTYGYQLLGSLGFFIPRSLWEGKPIGSGSTLASQANLHFDNISMPFIAEGFINFSIFGSIIFVFIFGYFSGKIDYFYWTLKKYLPNHWSYGAYYLALGMSFFILRGDLLSSTAYTVAILGTYATLLYIISYLTKLGKSIK